MKGGGGAPLKKRRGLGGGGETDRPADGQKPALRRPDRSAFIRAAGGGGTRRRAPGSPSPPVTAHSP